MRFIGLLVVMLFFLALFSPFLLVVLLFFLALSFIRVFTTNRRDPFQQFNREQTRQREYIFGEEDGYDEEMWRQQEAFFEELFRQMGGAGYQQQTHSQYDRRTYSPPQYRVRTESQMLAELGLLSDATNDQIRSAYRKKVLQYHPDRYANRPEAEQKAAAEKFKSLQAVYEELRRRRGF